MRRCRSSLLFPLLALAGCAGRPSTPVVAVVAPPPAVALPVPLPEGASPGMLVPDALADGGFPTPNRGLSAAGTLWHLRAGLNVAALSCPGDTGAAIRAGYNDWLRRRKAVLAAAATAYAAEYRAGSPTGRALYDDTMTRLYNFWSQTPVRRRFCVAAAGMIGEIDEADDAGLATLAPDRLATLERPFVDFYRAYDAWRRQAQAAPVIAAAAAVPPTGATAPSPPRLVLDLSALPPDAVVTAAGRAAATGFPRD